MSWAGGVAAAPDAGFTGAVEALRTINLVGTVVLEANGEMCCCCTLAGRVHVEKELAAFGQGARTEGGNRFANALAGHNALLVSMIRSGCMDSGDEVVVNVAGRVTNFRLDVSTSCAEAVLAQGCEELPHALGVTRI